MFAGGTIGYKTKYQPFIAHSSMEAEFVAAYDKAKMILFLRSLLHEVGIEQQCASILFEDNNGALMMANVQQPRQRTHYMDIKHFAVFDRVERDMLILKAIQTHNNAAYAMTKTLPKQLFYRHLTPTWVYGFQTMHKAAYVQTTFYTIPKLPTHIPPGRHSTLRATEVR
jgi:hypothetical protein